MYFFIKSHSKITNQIMFSIALLIKKVKSQYLLQSSAQQLELL